jgi:hypothetical protein
MKTAAARYRWRSTVQHQQASHRKQDLQDTSSSSQKVASSTAPPYSTPFSTTAPHITSSRRATAHMVTAELVLSGQISSLEAQRSAGNNPAPPPPPAARGSKGTLRVPHGSRQKSPPTPPPASPPHTHLIKAELPLPVDEQPPEGKEVVQTLPLLQEGVQLRVQHLHEQNGQQDL